MPTIFGLAYIVVGKHWEATKYLKICASVLNKVFFRGPGCHLKPFKFEAGPLSLHSYWLGAEKFAPTFKLNLFSSNIGVR
ncbi:MAG: hypothetical protein DRR08_04915 [Candidatus Parabeggiatoa sp. nov. 2]|nr:MAG: hypothetical protein B6247_00620 [Beggiatoa sp. 4572_84]RKZ62866.1 MAG: hypothetical protein DRR08_04915 [Gammaproteobacteria bacterium]